MKQHREDERPEESERKAWFRRADFLLDVAIAVVLLLAASWFVNNPNSPGFWRSYP